MKHRKLRIAWSVAWGLAVMFVVVLWVRGYKQAHILDNPHGYKIDVKQGTLIVRERIEPPVPRPFLSPPFWTQIAGAVNSYGGWPSVSVASIPLWNPIVIGSVLIATPWILPLSRLRQFSLRSLLIAMALIAGALGTVVWLSH
jgi:hypothetical protein